MVLCGTKKWFFYGIAVKNLLSTFIFMATTFLSIFITLKEFEEKCHSYGNL